MSTGSSIEHLDLLGVGIGPFNLSLAAMSDKVGSFTSAFLERRQEFRWHPGMLIPGTTLQVPYLADLVSLVDPTSPWSFLNYLQHCRRLFPFYFAEKFLIDRAEYDAYCRWVSQELPQCHFGYHVEAVRWHEAEGAFAVDYTYEDIPGKAVNAGRYYARNLALGIGTEPTAPAPLRPLLTDPGVTALHSADYLKHRAALLSTPHVTVIGSGQSGAEIFLDLLRNRPSGHEGLRWITRSPAFAPMEYSKLGLEQFTPDYTRFFHHLPEPTRDRLVPQQWQLYKATSAVTLGEIHDELYRRTLDGGWPDAVLQPATAVRAALGRGGRIELTVEHTQQERSETVHTDAAVLATGYSERPTDGLLEGLDPYIVRDSSGRPLVDDRYRLVLDSSIRGDVFVQNAERHTHGVGAPDLGLAAWRSASIVNTVTDREVFALPSRTAFTTFGVTGGDGDRSPEQDALPQAAGV
ncbi:lysine N(6)-hydroxylase/L-ornithine N(5)-oxygenase family protein [Streptomyces sp. NPDC001339]|uniref:lysine N(6)-hydroxylase/L-ornithine N(5)-oxygenase family protein n=1 Tax=Streptomyces sp. NPDC001339 TaxID=3364563 RepID=UPI0036B1B675